MQQQREWQRRAKVVVGNLRDAGKDRALIAACPGAGKTAFAVDLIVDDLGRRAIDCGLVVVPSRYLKYQWQVACQGRGVQALLDIDNGTLEERRARGMRLYDPERPVLLVTYQQVASFPELFATLTRDHRVFAVFDEIHHADESADFGESLRLACEAAVFKLSLSGTPFNTKGGTLAFCESKVVPGRDGKMVNRTLTDFEYSFGEALRASGRADDPDVVRTVNFTKWDGIARWQYTHVSTGEVSERIFDGRRKNDSLTPLVDPSTASVRKMLRTAVEELAAIRKHHVNAAMLVTASGKDECHIIRDFLMATPGSDMDGCGFASDDIMMVVYDTPDAHRQIERFMRGRQRVMIAIKMISEGVDITRLRVGVYASNVLTPMFFSQFVGRFVRWDRSLGAGQAASILIPEHVELIAFAKEIEAMIAEAAVHVPLGQGGEGPGPTSFFVTAKSSDGALGGAIAHGRDHSAEERAEVMAWAEDAGVNSRGLDLAILVALYRAPRPEHTAPPPDRRSDAPPYDLGRANDKQVGRYVQIAKGYGLVTDDDRLYTRVQAWANRAVAIPRKDRLTSPTVLQERLTKLVQLTARLIDEKRLPHDLL
jgi:superfamily II DNA or RNA helicase